MSKKPTAKQETPSQQIVASDGSTIKDVIQSVISGQVSGDVHIGDKIYTRSEIEELRDYMGLAITTYAARMGRNARLAQNKLPDTPYRSLEYFDLAHTAVFYGRQAVVKEFLTQIKPDNRRLTLLHAPSGAGKTSFIRAGVEPALWREEEVVLYARAFADPVAALKQIIVNSGGPGHDLADLSLYEFLQWFRPSLLPDQRLIIFFDQFEEFFILLDDKTRANFIDQLGRCLEDETLPLRVVLSLRKDYLAEMEAFKARIPDIFHNTCHLPPLTRDQAAQAITEPAAAFKVKWKDDIVDKLLKYLTEEEIAPPHLQLICTRLYEHAVEIAMQEITSTHLDALGGLKAIHKDYLINEMQALRGPQGIVGREEVGWRLLKALVTTQGTKVPRTPAYLGDNVDADPATLTEVLDRLVERRVVRRDTTPQGITIIEITHDTLAAEIQTRQSPQEIRSKAALELIERERLSYNSYGTLMGAERLRILDEYRDDLPRLRPEATVFMLRSAVAANHEVKLWFERAVSLEKISPFDIISELLQNQTPLIRANAATSLGEIGGDEAINLLAETIFDEDEQVRQQVFASLLRLDTPKTQKILEKTPPQFVTNHYEKINQLAEMLLTYHTRRNKLLEQQALQGINTDPRIWIEVEDIFEKINDLQQRLEELGIAKITGNAEWQTEESKARQNRLIRLTMRLQILEERKAQYGPIDTPQEISIEIEEIKATITRLKNQNVTAQGPTYTPKQLQHYLDLLPTMSRKLTAQKGEDLVLAFKNQFQRYKVLLKQQARLGFDCYPEILIEIEEVRSGLIENILERWRNLGQLAADQGQRKFELNLVSERIVELQQTTAGLKQRPASGQLNDLLTTESQELNDWINLQQHFSFDSDIIFDATESEFAQEWLDLLYGRFRISGQRYNALLERKALRGLDCPLEILIEIEDLSSELLENILERWRNFGQSAIGRSKLEKEIVLKQITNVPEKLQQELNEMINLQERLSFSNKASLDRLKPEPIEGPPDHLKRLAQIYSRRLSGLRKEKAIKSFNCPIHVEVEIKEIEQVLDRFRNLL